MTNPTKERSINIDLDIHKELKLQAIEQSTTLKYLVNEILRKHIKKIKNKEKK